MLSMKLSDLMMFLHSYPHVSNLNFDFYRLIRKAPNLEVNLTLCLCCGRNGSGLMKLIVPTCFYDSIKRVTGFN